MSDDEDVMLRPPVLSAKQRHVARLERACREELTVDAIYNLLYAIGPCDSIHLMYPVACSILMELFKTKYVPHDDDGKFVGVCDFSLRRNALCQDLGIPDRLELWIRRFDKSTDSISWITCFEGPVTDRMKLISAMKLATHNHPIDLERRSESMRLADIYLVGLTPPTAFIKNKYHQWAFREEDHEFKEAWLVYYRASGARCKRCIPRVAADADGWTTV